MAEMFPKIEVATKRGKKIAVHLYGFSHGIGKKGTALHHTVANALRTEVKSFHYKDYVIREGSDDTLLRYALRKHGAGFHIRVSRDFLWDTLKTIVPSSAEIEPIEHFEVLRNLQASEGGKINHTSFIDEELRKKEISPDIQEASRLTMATQEQTQKSKDGLVEALRKRGIDENKAREYTESLTTFRSLLMARAAYHRAYATGLPIRLFVGFNHVKEIEDFLSDEKKQREYVANLPPKLKQIYDLNEQHGWNVVELFEQNAHKFPGHEKRLYAWLALECAKPHYSPDKSDTVVVDIAKFRRLIER